MSIPKTLVKLCYVPFSPTNQLDFENLEKQKEYFEHIQIENRRNGVSVRGSQNAIQIYII